MRDLGYTLAVSDRALNVLANIYSPRREECGVLGTLALEGVRIKPPPFYKCATGFKELEKSLGVSADSLKKTVREELFGLVGVVRESFAHHTDLRVGGDSAGNTVVAYTQGGTPVYGKPTRVIRYNGIYVPQNIFGPVQQSIDREPNDQGLHEIGLTVSEESLPLLDYIYRRTEKLIKGRSARMYPQFYITELRRISGMGKSKVRGLMNDLFGVTSEMIHPINLQRYKKTVFLPPCRSDTAKALLNI